MLEDEGAGILCRGTHIAGRSQQIGTASPKPAAACWISHPYSRHWGKPKFVTSIPQLSLARREPVTLLPLALRLRPFPSSPPHRVLHRGGGSRGSGGALPRFLPSRQAQRCGFCRTPPPPQPRLHPAGGLPSPRAGALRSRFAGFHTPRTLVAPLPNSHPRPQPLAPPSTLGGFLAPIPIPIRPPHSPRRFFPPVPSPLTTANS